MSNQDQPPRPPTSLSTTQLETPRDDSRSYKHIVLPNQVEVLIVHDASTDQASAAMDVGVGYFGDGEVLGTAHLAEHTVAKASSGKFKEEYELNRHVSANSGTRNAWTDSTSTNYHFGIISSGDLFGTLDRFAQGFIDPVFSPSLVDRETELIVSEHNKNLRNDYWRIMQVQKSTSNPKYPWYKFSTGNHDTLIRVPKARGIDMRERIKAFYESQYSGNRMKLAIIGKEPLSKLEEWANLFAGIQNKSLPDNRWDTDVPLRQEDLSTQTFVKLIKNNNWVELEVPFPDEASSFECQPSGYLNHLFCHEGAGSLFRYLKPKGVTGISTDLRQMCPGSPGIFLCRIHFTESDIGSYQAAVKVFFHYICLLRKSPLQELARIFDELRQIAEIKFNLRSKKSIELTQMLSGNMQRRLPVKWILAGPRQRKFEEDSILAALACFRPDNFKMTIASPKFPGNWNQKEKWYNTEFRHEKIPVQFLDELKIAVETPLPELHLPRQNLWISKVLGAFPGDYEKSAVEPRLIRNDKVSRVWYKSGFHVSEYKRGQAYLVIHCKTPLVHATPANFVKGMLYAGLVEDAIEQYFHDASCLGVGHSIRCHSTGIVIQLHGEGVIFQDLLQNLLTTMKDLQVGLNFEVVKGGWIRVFENCALAVPYHQLFWLMKNIWRENWYTHKQMIAELRNITVADIVQFYPTLWQMQVDILVGGELRKEQALELSLMVESILNPTPLPETDYSIVTRSLDFPPTSNFVFIEALDDLEAVDHGIKYILFLGARFDGLTRAKAFLLDQMTHAAAFDQLRAREKLGYSVWSGTRENGTSIGFEFTIQSTKPPLYLEERIECFLTEFAAKLVELKDHDFENHKRNLVQKILEKTRSEELKEEMDRFWAPIKHGHLDFVLEQHDATHLEKLTKENVVEFYKEYFLPTSPLRSKLVIQLIAQNAAQTQAKEVEEKVRTVDLKEDGQQVEAVLIKNIKEFKSMMEVKASPQPIKDIKGFEDLDVV
ncbi:related to insulysin precursor (metalloendopeptidase) [Phialocephala subalpina]|uniref:Related to insulysin (Metalloendopeptidase) n=1 Tax=Phialocephala subalpina TaxID=576137 RepID=A0A1L7WSE9_9HELO|nr:related to insulysin precursor (metalloendopeptidase) [Phialocephala subalpina]